MKAEAWIFTACTLFFALVSPTYWFASGEWAGTLALGMCALLMGMIALYLGFHARQMDPRPEDRKDGEVADGAGELGFFPPFSWWPLWCAACLSTVVFAVAMTAWWLFIIGTVIGFICVAGLVFEYYRGEHAH